jgi:hypothetical protein
VGRKQTQFGSAGPVACERARLWFDGRGPKA